MLERTDQVFHTLVTNVVGTQTEIRHAAVLMLEHTDQVFHTLGTDLVVIQVESRHATVFMDKSETRMVVAFELMKNCENTKQEERES